VRGSANELGIMAANVAIQAPAVVRPCDRGDANVPHELDQVARVHAATAFDLLQGDAS
jgi:ABC-type sulfate transport system permease component